MSRLAGVLGCALLAASCLGPAEPDTQAPLSEVAPSPGEGLGIDFFTRQDVVARVGGDRQGFEIALESCGDTLRVVGLTGFGLRLFSAVRDGGGEVAVETLGGRELPFPPERMLRDIERTFFRSTAPRDGSPATVERAVSFGGEAIRERWHDGRLVAREVDVGEAPEDPPLVIRYTSRLLAPGIPERITLENPLFGYALEIRNHGAEALECGR